ncbi:hypothetical protein ARMSODRAFT_978247 [Armillaria solidipes]|uniref:Uncharacterized protein n=1 Tax=Armillaria solidipes TaxID=1076256 RepID=A0A2H3B3F1_9AGAR|nr:hypothetical protein ARMSODRAFT_978247 [Armillaria solidipes]
MSSNYPPPGSPLPGDETLLVSESSGTVMDEIWEEYQNPSTSDQQTGDTVHNRSTKYRVQYYGEYELQATDVIAQEYECFTNRPSFTLQPQLLEAIQNTVNELQAALTVASTLIPLRSTWYRVDPNDTFMDLLKGTNNVKLLNAAWRGLVGRLKRGHRFLEKYTMEYECR